MIPLLVSVLVLGAVQGSAVAQTQFSQLLPVQASNVPCVSQAREALRPLAYLRHAQGAQQVAVTTHKCNGGLYFRADSADWILHEGWWLQELVSMRWAADGVIQVRARFYTGAGPDGVKPFAAELTIARVADGWAIDGPNLRAQPFDIATTHQIDGFDTPAIQVLNAEQEENLRISQAVMPVTVDYSAQRLYLLPLRLTSGSIRVRDLAVTQQDDHYAVHWRLDVPRIGTMDMNPSTVFVVLPKDGLPLRRAPEGAAPGSNCSSCQVVVRSRTWVPYPDGYVHQPLRAKGARISPSVQ